MDSNLFPPYRVGATFFANLSRKLERTKRAHRSLFPAAGLRSSAVSFGYTSATTQTKPSFVVVYNLLTTYTNTIILTTP